MNRNQTINQLNYKLIPYLPCGQVWCVNNAKKIQTQISLALSVVFF